MPAARAVVWRNEGNKLVGEEAMLKSRRVLKYAQSAVARARDDDLVNIDDFGVPHHPQR